MAVHTQTPPSIFLLALSILCAIVVDIAMLYSNYDVLAHVYLFVVGVTNATLFVFHEEARGWTEAFFKLQYGWVGTGVEDTLMTVVASVLAVFREHSGYGIIIQIGFYIQVMVLNLILKPASDLGLQAIASRVPILTAMLLYGMSLKAFFVITFVVGLMFGRRYLETVSPVTVVAEEDETVGSGG